MRIDVSGDPNEKRMRCVGLIPARMASSRFPGKPLARILGLSMLEHIYRRARLSALLEDVAVTTCDEAIRVEAERFGTRALMTSDRHERAMERVAEAAEGLEAEVIVLIQGDEPLLHPAMLEELLRPFHDEPGLLCTNLMVEIGEAEARDPNQVKVAVDQAGNALYMSREPLPTLQRGGRRTRWRQVGLIAFQRAFLLRLVSLPTTPLEQAESIDMLRAIEHGFHVRMVPTRHSTHPVDTPDDVATVEALMHDDPVLELYAPLSHR